MKTERLLALVMLLLDHDSLSATKLAEIFSVSTRTIYRDAETLNLAGIPIVTTTGVHGGIGIMKEYKVDKRLFSQDDLSTLLIGLGSIAQTLQTEDLTKTLQKVQSLIPQEHTRDITLKANQLSIDLTSWINQGNFQAAIDSIQQALAENQLISFTYYDKKGTKTKRTLEPYRLVLKETSWYVEGYCLERLDFRLFKLARLSSLHLTKKTFKPRAFTPRQVGGKDWIHPKLEIIQLIADISLREKMIEHCGHDNVVEKDGLLYVDFPFMRDDFGYNMLLGLGHKSECIAPLDVREELIARIASLQAVYLKESIV